jgi:hypothetical protein
MLCRGVVQEARGPKSCWLPADRSSSFQLCRRCHFHRVTDIVDTLTDRYSQGELHPPNEMLLNSRDFLSDLLHPAREQALLNLLVALHRYNKVQFLHVIHNLRERSVFCILLLKRLETHRPGRRCAFYRELLKDATLWKSEPLLFCCWECLAWGMQQRDPILVTKVEKSIPKALSKITLDLYTASGPNPYVDFCVAATLREKEWYAIAVVEFLFHLFPLETVRSFLTRLVLEEPFRGRLFCEQDLTFLPLPLREAPLLLSMRKEIYKRIKQETNRYKEDLIIKTWHPDRLFSWCFDLDDLKDF